jgi:hypothetical protein
LAISPRDEHGMVGTPHEITYDYEIEIAAREPRCPQ